MIFLATGGFCSRNAPRRSLTKRLHRARDVGVQLALGLAFELRLRQLDADDDDQPLAHVVAGEVLLHVLEETERLPGALMVRVSAVGSRRDACRRRPC
jgi:hypothetical protein